MKKEKTVPKYIDKLLERRKNYALNFLAVDTLITDWMEKNGIPLNYVSEEGERLEDCVNTGAVSICEPYVGYETTRRLFEEYLNERK